MAAALSIAAGLCASTAPDAAPRLRQGFAVPPESARPWVWWHWMNGNVTQRGIRKDLKWMHGVGIGGVNVIDASLFTPVVVRHPLVYMSSRWRDAFRLAARLATRYRMGLSIDSSPGWSETGGPWVAPQDAMKKLVWSATVITGGKPYHGSLPLPPSNSGPFQDAPMTAGVFGPSKFADLRFYRDSLVIAYRAPILDPRPAAGTSSVGAIGTHALAELADGNLRDGITVNARHGRAWLQLRYATPVRLQGCTLAASVIGMPGASATVYVSKHAHWWRKVATLKPSVVQLGGSFPEETVSFAPTMARYVRLVLRAASPQNPFGGSFAVNAAGAVPMSERLGKLLISGNTRSEFLVHEFVPHSRATINRFEAKADYSIVPDYRTLSSTAPLAPGTSVNPQRVVNLTGRMKPDGMLDWTPAPGRWVVLRMGYSLEGTTNHPAPPAATGLEVDKLSRADVDRYMTHYLAMFGAVTGPAGADSLTALTTDSTEVGMQNWTPHLIADFERLRGYDPTPWLPALTGVVVGGRARSDEFLWDFRRTIDELLARNHYGEIQRNAHASGLVTYGEALEDHRPTFGDDMAMRRFVDVPMGAMWMYPPGARPFPTYVADIKGAASVAHIYGKNLVGAESLDSVDQPWAFAPRQLKPVIDEEFLLGVNRVIIHESAEQALDRAPGLSLGFFGQMFDRLDPWAAEAGPWMRYIARCSYLLQQGRFAADIAYFYGQGTPITSVFGDRRIDVPAGYGFDFVDPDALRHRFRVVHGRLVTRSGMSYRLLYLGQSGRWMSLGVLRRIAALVREGATLVGRRPLGSPSLRDDPAQFRGLARALFGPPGIAGERRFGKGRVFADGSLPRALHALGVAPDFEYGPPGSNIALRAIHRTLADGDLYFVTNRRDRRERLNASFRVSGRVPQLWDPVSGSIEPVAYRILSGRTQVPLRLAPYGSVFVVFGAYTQRLSRRLPAQSVRTLVALRGPWRVEFQPDRGAPANAVLGHLASWTTNPLSAVRYFSGTGTYSKSFRLSLRDLHGRLLLDLGQVRDLAKVTVDGHAFPALWTPPFRVDITPFVHSGANSVSIAVTNRWVNRLIGDARPGATRKYTFTTLATYEPDAPLRPAGLLGPVRIERLAVRAGGR